MEGRGVTNFSADTPTHGFTTKTTEFDDQLIKRGIVTTEQAMMAKGASAEEAFRLAEEKRNKNKLVETLAWQETSATDNNNNSDDDESDDSDSFEDDFDDDAFLQEYRSKRLHEMKQELNEKQQEYSHSSPYSVLHITRDEWTTHVNEASMDRWVMVTMVEASGERKDRVVQELERFHREFCEDSDDDKTMPSLLTIKASDAIPNWPAERVPAMFAYREGVKQHEWIASKRGEFPPANLLERLFRTWKTI